MKNKKITAICVIAGVSSSLVVTKIISSKNASEIPLDSIEKTTDEEMQKNVENASERSTHRSITEVTPSPVADEDQAADEELMKSMLSGLFDKKAKSNSGQKIKSLSKLLDLTPKQLKKLKAYYKKNKKLLGTLTKLDSEGLATLSAEENNEIVAAINESDLADYMSDDLAAEQQDLLAKHQQTVKDNKVDDLALKEMVGLSGALGLSEEQRQEAYSLLATAAASQLDSMPDKKVISKYLADSFGMGDMSSLLDAMENEMDDVDPENVDLASLGPALKKAQEAESEKKVETLKAILSEDQQNAYRDHLNSQSSFMNTMIQAASAAEAGKEE